MKHKIHYCLLLVLALSLSTNILAKRAPADFVNPLIGTGFHGHTYPGATVPFGAVQLSPDTRRGNWDACSGYHYDDSTMMGFSHTHLSGTGCIDLGDVLFRPTTQRVDIQSDYICPPAIFSHQDEKVSAGYYSVLLKNENIKAELTSTMHVGMHRYTFPKDKPATIVIDLAHLLDNEKIYESSLQITEKNELVGMRKTGGWTDNQYVFFVVQFSKPFRKVQFLKDKTLVSAETKLTGTKLKSILNFDTTDGRPVVAKVGISIVSIENARKNLEQEVKDFDFDEVHKNAVKNWNNALSGFTVKSSDKDDLVNFYTALYHSMVVPNTINDVNGEYRRHSMKIDRVPSGRTEYSTFSIWDTFRAWNPLMTLIDNKLVNDMINSYLNTYDDSGELPIWPLSAGETGTMIGYHSVSVIADAYMKGIRGFDAEKALKAMIASSEKNKKGADYYIKYGFIPSNIKKESVSCLLEFAYDDWCIARMAKAMNKEDVYNTYMKRSQNYINVFDGSTKFFRGKRMDGNWEQPFDPYVVSRDFTEATAWQYRYFVPHDVYGMTQQFGGKDEFLAALDSLFTANSELQGELQDITGMMGQYAHGNEPSHHIAYLYNYAGQPWKTQELTRKILSEMYNSTPQGIIGNEDCGQMSAWYIFSSLGFYPVCPGSNEFVFTSPLFEKSVIKLASGKKLTILANNPKNNIYIDEITLNGKEIKENFISYEQIMAGGVLKFTLTSKPNLSRGTGSESSPYSFTSEPKVSIPYVNEDLNLFRDSIQVSFGTATPNAEIYFTIDGSEPTKDSRLYHKPIMIDKTTRIRAKGYKVEFVPSEDFTIIASKAILRETLNVKPTQQGTNYKYYEGTFKKVADIEQTPLIHAGTMAKPTIEDAVAKDHFGYDFFGYINVPEDGIYIFQTQSDDGSVLYVDNELVVDNDGSHAAIPATGTIALKKGFHSYRLLYLEDYEGEHLSWSWKIPSAETLQSIPDSVLYVD